MTKPLRVLTALILPALLASTPVSAQTVSVEDFAGRTVTLAAPARRIVTLAPHSAENLFSAGAGDRLVGVVEFSNYPPEASNLPIVGSYNAYSVEAIASLRPDLVVMWGSGNGMQTLERLEPLGVPVYVSEPRQLGDIPRVIRQLGLLAGTADRAEPEALRIERTLAELRAHYSTEPAVSVFYEIWNQPLQTVNGQHLISQVIALCGGSNVFAGATPLAPQVSVESVLGARPQAIIASGMGEARPEWLEEWRAYPTLPAVRDGALFFIDPDHLQRPTARVLLGAQALCEQLQSARRNIAPRGTEPAGAHSP